MAKTKSAVGPDIAAEAAPEQFAINPDTPSETPPAPEMTEAEAAILAQEGEAVLKQMGDILPDPGEMDAPVPDFSDTVIPFADIISQAQEPVQQPPEVEQDAPPSPEAETPDKPEAEKVPEQAPDKSEGAQETAKKGQGKAAEKAPDKPKPEKRGKAAKETKTPKEPPKPERDAKTTEAAEAKPPGAGGTGRAHAPGAERSPATRRGRADRLY